MAHEDDREKVALLERRLKESNFQSILRVTIQGYEKDKQTPLEGEELKEFVSNYAMIRDVLQLAFSFPDEFKKYSISSFDVGKCIDLVNSFEPSLISKKTQTTEFFQGVSFSMDKNQPSQEFALHFARRQGLSLNNN